MTTSTVHIAPPEELEALEDAAAALDRAEPEEILRWVLDRYGDDVALACSFGGISGLVLLDMVQKLNPRVEVYYVDTDFLFPETYQTVEAARGRWPEATIRAYKTDLTPEQQARLHGEALWERDPDLCCAIRKVEPSRLALAGKRAWITGVRRAQSAARASTPAVHWDSTFGLAKASPLVNWDEKRLWAYIFREQIPYNPLLDQGFPSIGCTHCTRAVRPGEDARAGRWPGFAKDECGINIQPVEVSGTLD